MSRPRHNPLFRGPTTDRALLLLRELIEDLSDLERSYVTVSEAAHGMPANPTKEGLAELSQKGKRDPQRRPIAEADPTMDSALDPQMQRARAKLQAFRKVFMKATTRYWFDMNPAYTALQKAAEQLDGGPDERARFHGDEYDEQKAQ